MKVHLRNPTREVEVQGPVSVNTLLARLDHDDRIEVRPVISGGSGAGAADGQDRP